MRSFYVIPEKRAIADVQPLPDGAWMITRLNVPKAYRGTGLGTRLLEMILADADAEGVTLCLGVVASDGLSFGALHDWYGRHGFKDLPAPFPGRMERPPCSSTS